MSSRIYLLVKIFDKEEYADAFIQKGELFCRTLGDFKKIDDGDARGDAYEAVTDWHQPDQISMTISYKDSEGVEHSFPLTDLAGPVVMQNTGYDRLNLYCMYGVKVPEFEESFEIEEERITAVNKINSMLKEKTTLSEEVISLGEFAVVVYQVEDFIQMVREEAKKRDFSCWNGSIGYYNPETFHGSFKDVEAVFRKRDSYSHQNEYRFAFGSHEPEGTKTIHLGSLSKIAFKVATKDFNKLVEIKLAD